MSTAQLSDRIVILVEGPDAEHFLQNIITPDLDALASDEAKPGALLTPQGKILFDFLVSRSGASGFRLDCREDVADDFMRRLTLYKLRAKVEISKRDQALVLAGWEIETEASHSDSNTPESDSTWLADRRFPAEANVWRGYAQMAETNAMTADWAQLRITHGVAESGSDYDLGSAFPHDVLLDEAGGVGFRKGCYVGQEVVSRMQHRGTARRRVMLVASDVGLPPSGTELKLNGRVIGTLGSVAGNRGLAIVRTDRVRDALDSGDPITAGEAPITLSIPAWAKYTLPQDAPGAGEA